MTESQIEDSKKKKANMNYLINRMYQYVTNQEI